MELVETRTVIGETAITNEQQISLPAEALQALGWKCGDRLTIELVGDDRLVLRRRPNSYVEYFAGKLGHVFGTHEEIMQYLEEERRSWDEE
ncbi:MAG: AbrB/MazE/SpoVT family DNA-binding domain-containing protein [Candidatus Dormibacteraceae bacterium]